MTNDKGTIFNMEHGPLEVVLSYLSYEDIFKRHVEVVCKSFERAVDQSLFGRDLCLNFGGSYYIVNNLDPKNYPCFKIWTYPKNTTEYYKNYREIKSAIRNDPGLYKIANIFDFSYSEVFPLQKEYVQSKIKLYNFKKEYAIERSSKLMYKIVKSAKWTKNNAGVLYQIMIEKQFYIGNRGYENKIEQFCATVFRNLMYSILDSNVEFEISGKFRLLMKFDDCEVSPFN